MYNYFSDIRNSIQLYSILKPMKYLDTFQFKKYEFPLFFLYMLYTRYIISIM